MNWSDPITYIALYLFLTIFVGVPTLRHIIRYGGPADDRGDVELFYAVISCLIVTSSVVAVIYWGCVAIRLIWIFVVAKSAKCIFNNIIVRAVNSVVNDKTKELYKKHCED